MTDISREAVEELCERIERAHAYDFINTTVKLRALRDALDRAESDRLFLWDLLDDIDTLDDACKDDDKSFRTLCYQKQRRRYEVSSSDGYTVSFPPLPYKPQEDV